jgi:DNA-directed RNA polymerase specialized sigma24 family protein
MARFLGLRRTTGGGRVTEIQQITLRDVLRQQGLSERSIEDVELLLRFKPDRVQMVFYYAAQGWTQQDIASVIGVDRTTVHYYLNNSMSEIKLYLMENQNTA